MQGNKVTLANPLLRDDGHIDVMMDRYRQPESLQLATKTLSLTHKLAALLLIRLYLIQEWKKHKQRGWRALKDLELVLAEYIDTPEMRVAWKVFEQIRLKAITETVRLAFTERSNGTGKESSDYHWN